DVFDSVMDEKHLTSSLNFVSNRISDYFFAKRNKLRFNRITVRWRRSYYRQIASCHKRKLQRSRNWCGCQSERIDIMSDGFEFVFYVYSEFLLFIHNQKT